MGNTAAHFFQRWGLLCLTFTDIQHTKPRPTITWLVLRRHWLLALWIVKQYG